MIGDSKLGDSNLGDSTIRWPRLRSCLVGPIGFLCRDDSAAQLVEFAVALPLLVLFVVGIFDFSNAFTFKQKLTNIARDAARVAAGDPANDLQSPSTPSGVPASVLDAFQVVDNYLLANNINDCGITPSSSPSPPLTWKSTASAKGCSTPGLTIIINRGYYFPAALATQPANCQQPQPPPSGQPAVIGTCVSIQYAYQWRYGRIASVLGSTMSLPTSITVAAVAMNEN